MMPLTKLSRRDVLLLTGAAGIDAVRPHAAGAHFDLLGSANRLVTQMYFAGEPLNDTDGIIQTVAANRHRLIVPFERPASPGAPDALVGTWDIVLDEG